MTANQPKKTVGARVSAVTEDPKLAAGLAAAGTLIVGAFAAVGISGDLLPRMVRNEPIWTAVLVCAALILVAIAVFSSNAKLIVVPLTLVLLGIVVTGVLSLQQRENPQVAVTADVDESGKVLLAVTASASSLRSDERMLVQLVGLTRELAGGELKAACRQSQSTADADRDDLDVLISNETGSAANGASSLVVQAFAAEDAYVRYCALAILGERSVSNAADDRFAWAYIDTPVLPAVPEATTPAPTATGP